VERASVVGSSFGGYSALRSAAALPDRIDRVVLAGFPAFVPRWRAPSFFTLLRTPLLGRLLLAAPATRSSAHLSLKQLGHRRSLAAGRIPGPMVDWTVAWQRHTGTMRNEAAMIIGLGSWRGGFDGRLDLTARDIAEVRAPCLIVAGSGDPVGAVPESRHLESLLPDAAVEVVDGGGHLPWLDDPGRVARLVTSWVRAGAGSDL
jgi:pimeloyl-ACP methyl ester carboxylesterase